MRYAALLPLVAAFFFPGTAVHSEDPLSAAVFVNHESPFVRENTTRPVLKLNPGMWHLQDNDGAREVSVFRLFSMDYGSEHAERFGADVYIWKGNYYPFSEDHGGIRLPTNPTLKGARLNFKWSF